jgi:transcriptional regulator with XRE-family HTH domain
MDDDAALFWENVKREIKLQNTTQEWVAKKAGISFNTFQGWIAKGIFPRANEALRIAAALNASVEFLALGTIRDNRAALGQIFQDLAEAHARLEEISRALRKL